MPQKKRILFIINGFGMGNATRCEGAMDFVKDDFDIDVITSDKAYDFFGGNPKISNLYRQMDIGRERLFKFGSFFYYLSQAHFFVNRLFRNYHLQKKIISASDYELVIFDSDYSFILHRIFGKMKLAGINNSFEVVQYFKRHRDELKLPLLFSYLIEVLDNFVCRTFLHCVYCPSVASELIKKQSGSKIFIGPLLVRASVFAESDSGHDSSVVFMASSSGVKSELYQAKLEYDRQNQQKFSPMTFEKNNLALLRNASVIFCNSGQSSIAECFYLNKAAVLYPIPKHAEQWVNAQLAENGRIKTFSGESIPELLAYMNSQPFAGARMTDYAESRTEFMNFFKAALQMN